jgi:acetyltransferase-like isoleucine patch superfamily enzyme
LGFTCRFDEGNPGEELGITDSTIGEKNTFHASGNKSLNKVDAGNECVFHGTIDISQSSIGDSVIMHNVTARNSRLHSNSILLGVKKLDNVSIGGRNTVIGHHGPIVMENVATGDEVVILHNVTVIGKGKEDQQIWLGDGVKINHNVYLYGYGEVPDGTVFGPNAVYEIRPDNIKKLTPDEVSKLMMTTENQGVSGLLSTIHDQLGKVLQN